MIVFVDPPLLLGDVGVAGVDDGVVADAVLSVASFSLSPNHAVVGGSTICLREGISPVGMNIH